MAKKQRTLSTMLFRRTQADAAEQVLSLETSSSASATSTPVNPIELAQKSWKDAWYTTFSWIDFNSEIGKVFCKTCKEKGGRSVFATTGSVNIRISAFQDHARSEEHKRLSWALQSRKKVLEKAVAQANRTCNEAVLILFCVAYYIGRETISFNKFTPLYELLVTIKACITKKLYLCADIVYCISRVIQRKKLDRVKISKFYGIMIDESTDISVTSHLVVFASFIEEGLPVAVFLELLFILDGQKDAAVMFEKISLSLKDWGLDPEKCVGFGSNGASTMVGKRNGVAALLKTKINPFFIFVHCVAHRTNLAALEAAKSSECKDFLEEVDSLLNSLAAFLKKSSKRKVALQALQNEFYDAQKSLKRYHKIRWLFRWQAVTSLCDSLEIVLNFLRDVKLGKEDGGAPALFCKLRSFKMIYVLYFLANILHMLSMLSRIFQHKFVDVSCIGSIVKTKITQIQMLFINERADLNQSTFNESFGFAVMPEFGPPGGYLRRLSFEIRGSSYHRVKMIRDQNGVDLEEALHFQHEYAQAVIGALEGRFEDNDIVSSFCILNPTNMPSRQVGLASWNVAELEKLCLQYGVERTINGKELTSFVNSKAVKHELFAFQVQSTTEWMEKSFKDLLAMMTWNSSLQLKNSNLLVLAEIARVHCVSTATCERAFSIHNCIKTKFCNKLKTQHLESVLCIALEGLKEDCEPILLEAIGLWKNSTKFWYLFSHPERYLSGQSTADFANDVHDN